MTTPLDVARALAKLDPRWRVHTCTRCKRVWLWDTRWYIDKNYELKYTLNWGSTECPPCWAQFDYGNPSEHSNRDYDKYFEYVDPPKEE